MPTVQIRGLGPVVVTTPRGETVLRPNGRAALLIALLVHANRVVPADELVDEVWPGATPDDPYAALHAQASRLRKDFRLWGAGEEEASVRNVHPGYLLRIDPACLDLTKFTDLADRCRLGHDDDPDEVAATARRALRMWGGTPFAGQRLGTIGQLARMRLEETRIRTLEALMEAGLRAGLHRHYLAELRELVDEHPSRERFAELLALARQAF